mgnify:CR=1 FL=1
MKPKVLKTDRDYKSALTYVERLMEQSSPDEAELGRINYNTAFPKDSRRASDTPRKRKSL